MKTERPFVVGIDRHSTRRFFVTNNPDRFFLDEDGTMISDRYEETNSNDLLNRVLTTVLKTSGIDCVFSRDADPVMAFIREATCRAVMFHASIEDMGNTTKSILKRREELLFVFLYNESQFQSCDSESYFREHNFKKIGTGFYDMGDKTYAMVKPQGMVSFIDFFRNFLGHRD